MDRKLPQLPTVDRIFCCFPLTVGAFMIALGSLVTACTRLTFIYTSPNTCAAFEDKYLFYTCLVNLRYFCDENPQTYESLFLLEVFLNIGGILSSLCLLVGSLFGFRILVGQYLYWTAILIFLRATSYFMNVIPLYKTYTEQDFTIMLWGPLCIMFSGYCWLACYSFLESIPLPIKVKGKK